MITTYLQMVSTSGRRWLDSSTLRPGDFAIVRTRSSISVQPRGSSPVVGSSKMYSCGSWTIDCASLIFCFMPVEYSAILRYRSSSTPTNWRTSWERLIAVSRSSPLIRPMYETRPTPVMSGTRQSCSGMYPIRSRTGTPSPMSRPRTFALPAVGCSRLRSSRKNVVFPAPLGPTSPIAPSGIWTVKSSTARTSPKTFVSPAVSTSTMVPSFLVAFRGGRSARRCPSLDSSFAAAPQEEGQKEDDRGRHRDDEEELNRAETGRRAGAIRVRPKTHLRRGPAVLVGDALHIESDIVREIRGLVAPAREACGNPREPRQGLVEPVCRERARFDCDVFAGEHVPMPRGGEVRLVLRAHGPAEDAERRVQHHMAGEIRRRVLADLQIERWDGRHRCGRVDSEGRHELRRDDERHVGVIRLGAVGLDRHVRLILPVFGRRCFEGPGELRGPETARPRDGPVEVPGRSAIDSDRRNRRISGEDIDRSDHVDVDEPNEAKLKRALARVESGEGAQRGVEDIDPVITRRVRRLVQRRSGRRGGQDRRNHHDQDDDAQNATTQPTHRRPFGLSKGPAG